LQIVHSAIPLTILHIISMNIEAAAVEILMHHVKMHFCQISGQFDPITS